MSHPTYVLVPRNSSCSTGKWLPYLSIVSFAPAPCGIIKTLSKLYWILFTLKFCIASLKYPELLIWAFDKPATIISGTSFKDLIAWCKSNGA